MCTARSAEIAFNGLGQMSTTVDMTVFPRGSQVTSCAQVNQNSRMSLDSLYAKSGASLAIQACSSDENAPTIAFIAKVFWTDKSALSAGRAPRSNPGPRPPEIPVIRSTKESAVSETKSNDPDLIVTDTDTQKPNLETTARMALLRSPLLAANPFADVEFVALARIFSGRVFPGQRLFVLGPKFDGRKVRGIFTVFYSRCSFSLLFIVTF
ncbi:hypothetical protein FGIG_11749 [Fasciola gigantica]|uniref:Uncharacterized protein n=1 Tax=Fasciola gigantica TaxID=46835 RepID=A0A504YV55_FASGI|nr:hypothetical protein FGIG_11749 [Fasciola gigantica]